jgi:hypothetical protein
MSCAEGWYNWERRGISRPRNVHPSCRPDRLLVDTKLSGAKGGLTRRRAYIIVSATPAKTTPIAISVKSVPGTIALSMGGPE